MHQHAVGPEIERGYGRVVGHDELHFAVNSAVEVHVGRCGEHVVAAAVAHDDHQRVVGSEADLVGDLEGEGRGAAAVGSDIAAVDEKVGHRLHAVEFQEDPLRGPIHGHEDAVQIVARCFEPLSLCGRIGVPAVGQGDVAGVVGRALGLEEEPPAFVQGEDLAGLSRCDDSCEQEKQYVTFHDEPVLSGQR